MEIADCYDTDSQRNAPWSKGSSLLRNRRRGQSKSGRSQRGHGLRAGSAIRRAKATLINRKPAFRPFSGPEKCGTGTFRSADRFGGKDLPIGDRRAGDSPSGNQPDLFHRYRRGTVLVELHNLQDNRLTDHDDMPL